MTAQEERWQKKVAKTNEKNSRKIAKLESTYKFFESIEKIISQYMEVSEKEFKDSLKSTRFKEDLEKVIKPYLEGNIFKSEVFSSSKFQYDPIIMVKLIFFETKGLFKKKKVEIAENLY